MKVVHLLRHAKSDWGDPALNDHERPLNKRGIKAAKAMARRLAAENFEIDAVFCSTAKRARETFGLLDLPLRKVALSFHDALYMVSPGELLAFIRRAPENAASIMLVGHNPATHELALALTARAAPGQRQAFAALKEKYPTGALCSIRFAVPHWRQVAPATGTLLRFLRPRDLKAGRRSPRR
ncbi:MAG: histidine phosphatase family protein [Rhodospirillaceae bacterium]